MRRAVTDLRAKAAAARRKWLPLQLPEPRGGVGLIRSEIERLLAVLQIKNPVQIKWAPDLREDWTATHSWLAADRRHVIKLRPERAAHEVSRSLLHEVVHTAQAEAFDSPEDWHAAYARQKKAGYYDNTYEREAQLTVMEFGNDFRLAVTGW